MDALFAVDIDQALQMKACLEDDINDLIKGFEEHTGLCVESITLRHVQQIDKRQKETVSVELDVKL